MGIPVLNLNLAPPPSLWRRQHHVLGWAILAIGALSLFLSAGFTWRAYLQADRLGRQAEGLSRQALSARSRQADLQRELMAIDVTAEGPRWRLAERILSARSAPWSRITAELETCMVPDMRIRILQRTRTPSGDVLLKLKGEARTRAAQAAFIEALGVNPYFEPILLERENERQGGGLEFEGTVRLRPDPPPYQAPASSTGTPAHGSVSTPSKEPVTKPMPSPEAVAAAPLKPTLAPAGQAPPPPDTAPAPSTASPARSFPPSEAPESVRAPRFDRGRSETFRRSRPEARP